MRNLSSRFHKYKGPIKKRASTPPKKLNISPFFIRKKHEKNPKDKNKVNIKSNNARMVLGFIIYCPCLFSSSMICLDVFSSNL